MKANEGGGEKFRGVIFIFLFAYSNPAVLPYRKVHFYVFFLGAFCHTGKFTSIFWNRRKILHLSNKIAGPYKVAQKFVTNDEAVTGSNFCCCYFRYFWKG
jgi:hypothetical protein